VLFNNVVVCDPQEFMFGHEIEQKQDKLALQAAPYITLFFKIHRQIHIKKEKNHQNIKLLKTSTIYHLKNPSKNTLQFFFYRLDSSSLTKNSRSLSSPTIFSPLLSKIIFLPFFYLMCFSNVIL